MRTSDLFVIINGIIVLLLIGLLSRPEVSFELFVKFIVVLLKSGVIYAYLGFWALIAFFDITDRLYSVCICIDAMDSRIKDLHYMYEEINDTE